MSIQTLADLKALDDSGHALIYPDQIKITVGMATCGLAAGADAIFDTLAQRIKQRELDAALTRTGCIGSGSSCRRASP